MELGVLFDFGLNENRHLVRIEPSREEVDRHVIDALFEPRGIFELGRQAVQIDNAAVHLVLILKPDPVPKRPFEIPDMERSGRLHS